MIRRQTVAREASEAIAVGIVLFGILMLATTGTLAQPPLYLVAHCLKVLGVRPSNA